MVGSRSRHAPLARFRSLSRLRLDFIQPRGGFATPLVSYVRFRRAMRPVKSPLGPTAVSRSDCKSREYSPVKRQEPADAQSRASRQVCRLKIADCFLSLSLSRRPTGGNICVAPFVDLIFMSVNFECLSIECLLILNCLFSFCVGLSVNS